MFYYFIYLWKPDQSKNFEKIFKRFIVFFYEIEAEVDLYYLGASVAIVLLTPIWAELGVAFWGGGRPSRGSGCMKCPPENEGDPVC